MIFQYIRISITYERWSSTDFNSWLNEWLPVYLIEGYDGLVMWRNHAIDIYVPIDQIKQEMLDNIIDRVQIGDHVAHCMNPCFEFYHPRHPRFAISGWSAGDNPMVFCETAVDL